MKINPKKAALIGLAASTMFTATGCGANVSQNEEPEVCGPPVISEEPAEEPTTSDQTTTEEIIMPQQNEEPTVYGPPPTDK